MENNYTIMPKDDAMRITRRKRQFAVAQRVRNSWTPEQLAAEAELLALQASLILAARADAVQPT